MKPVEIIAELGHLNSFELLDLKEIQALEDKFNYSPLVHYLRTLKFGSKPETASSELLKALAKDVFSEDGFSEVKLQGGFIDFAIQENKVNPILIELKPCFEKATDKSGTIKGIKATKLTVAAHKAQVQKYLLSNDFLILTNLKEAYFFNRDSLIDYKPFQELPFTELLKQFTECENLWDTVRRLETEYTKPELENEFFKDLTKWYNELSNINFEEKNGFTKNELIVILLNKVIFIKTLEDFGLIPYKFLADEYFQKKDKWEIKGIYKILDNFFTEIEEWFWDYYDTELFRVKIWDYIEKDKRNLLQFEAVFERVLGVGQWEYAFGKGMIHYNYRKIDEDVFGKAYETFIAQSRKDGGIYYTHRLITEYMSQRLVEGIFEPIVSAVITAIEQNNYAEAKTHMLRLYAVTIADTTSGSGSYLIKCLRHIYGYYLKIASKLEWINQLSFKNVFDIPAHVADAEEFMRWGLLTPKDRRKLISCIILRHIYAIDIDDRALETAKTNMWKEAIKLEKGLFNFRKLGSEYNHILPSLQLNFVNADGLYDAEIEKQTDYLYTHHQNDIARLQQIRNTYITTPTEPEVIDEALEIKQDLRKSLEKEFFTDKLKKPLLVALEFFFLFFDANGVPLPKEKQGFTGIISNPPWEEIYPVKKEFANMGKYGLNKTDFEAEFEKQLAADDELKKRWDEYTNFYQRYAAFVSTHYHYHQLKPQSSVAMRSHLNYFKVFFERDMQLLQSGGLLNILIPSSFQTDEGGYGLRKLAFIDNTPIELFSFENRGFMEEGKTGKSKIFPEVDNRFKFSIVFLKKEEPQATHKFRGLFYLTDPMELYQKKPLEYSVEMVRGFSPNGLSVMEFEKEEDYALCTKILGKHPLLGQLGYSFRREFNVTDDAPLFTKENNKKSFPVFEGKTIHQFNSDFSGFNYYIDKETANNELIGKEYKRIKTDLKLNLKTDKVKEIFEAREYKLDYQTYRLAYRAIASSTNERTLITTVLPPNHFTVNSLNYLINCEYYSIDDNDFGQRFIAPERNVYLMALINSLSLNYYIRNKISANLNMFYMYELPIPEAAAPLRKKIIEKAFALLYHKSESALYQDLQNTLGIDKKLLAQYKEPATHDALRAELEVLIARDLFGLDGQDWEYLTSTFVYGENPVTRSELDAVIDISKGLF